MNSIEMKPTSLSRSAGRFTWSFGNSHRAPARTPKNKQRFGENLPPVPSTPSIFQNSDMDVPMNSEQLVQQIKTVSSEMKNSTKQMGRVLKDKVNEISEDFGMNSMERPIRLTTSMIKPRGGADRRMLRLSFMYKNESGVNSWLNDEDLSEELKKDAGPRTLAELNKLKACVNNLAIEFNSFLPSTHKDSQYGAYPFPRGVKRKPVPSSAIFEGNRISISDLNREELSIDQSSMDSSPFGSALMRQLSVAIHSDMDGIDEGSKSHDSGLDLAALAASDISSHKNKSRRLSLSRKSSVSSVSSNYQKFSLGDLPPTPTIPKVYSSQQKLAGSDSSTPSDSPNASKSSLVSSSESEISVAGKNNFPEVEKVKKINRPIRSVSSSEASSVDNSEDEVYQNRQETTSKLLNRRQLSPNANRNTNILALSSTPSRPSRRTRRPVSLAVVGSNDLTNVGSGGRPLGLDSKNLETLNELLTPLKSGKGFGGPTPRPEVLEWTESQIWKSESSQVHLSPTTPRAIPVPTRIQSSSVQVDSHPLSSTEEDSSSVDGDSESVNSFSPSSVFSSANNSSSNLSSDLSSNNFIEESESRRSGYWGIKKASNEKNKRSSIGSNSSFLDHPAFSDEELSL